MRSIMVPPMRPIKGGYGLADDGNPPSTNLWVGNLSHDATDSDLVDLFGNYGPLDNVATYSSRNFAFVYFKRVEDAFSAKVALNGYLFHGSSLKIEFARPARPSKSIWVGGLGPYMSKDDVEEEFSKFGKIEDLRFIKDRNCALVDYMKLDDAILAMKSMNGKRVAGEQIRVEFLRSHQQPPPFDAPVPRRVQNQVSGGRREAQPSNILWIGYPPSLQIDEPMLHNAMILFGEIERIKSFPTRHYSFVEFRSVDEARRAKEGLQGRLFNDPRISIMYSSSELGPGKEFSNLYPGAKPHFPDAANEPPYVSVRVDPYDRSMASPSRRLLHSPGSRVKPVRPASSGWDVSEPKRRRPDNGSFSPAVSDFIWRGTIAKGGTPVCHARCVPVGNGIESTLPEVVNCSARTGLDMLTKHYSEGVGFDVVMFLPDSEEDFASYTEFLRYLGSKNRAGVAKFDDGTTLFLVPPSDFLTDVLKVKGPERLYGVVLKLPVREDPKPYYHTEPQPVLPSTNTNGGVSLTPELIATLTSILPITSQAGATESGSWKAEPQLPNYPSSSSHFDSSDANGAYTAPFSNSYNGSGYHQVLPSPSDKGDGDVDKNQRYQSTLQFAASLLKGIQQQQNVPPP